MHQKKKETYPMVTSSALEKLNEILLSLAKSSLIDKGELGVAFQLLTEAAATGLQIARSSIWLYNEDETAIICQDLFETLKNTHSKGTTLKANDYPSYFNYLRQERTLAAIDARCDPATSEFAESYLVPLNITSLLDAPIRRKGKTIGVLCNENIGPQIHWTIEQQTFAGAIADIAARAMEAYERQQAQFEIETLNQNLEKLVEDRTRELEIQRARSVQSAKLVSLGEMAGGIAHEINSPLQSIKSRASLLQELASTEKLSAEIILDFSTKIEKTADRIAKIIQGLRNFSRDGSTDPLQTVQLKTVVEETLSFCRERIRFHKIDLRVGIVPDISFQARIIEISQVLLNLIINAFDAAVEHSRTDPTQPNWVALDFREHEDDFEILVSDSGPGIAENIHTKIFQPFFTTKEIGKGIGLGLSLSKGIIENHHGTLTLDSCSKNTLFVIRLPKKRVS